MPKASKRGLLVVVSGPSGSGKTTLVERAVRDLGLTKSISATSRLPRAGELDGRDYHFLSKKEFNARVEKREFLEYALVCDNLYGTLRRPVEEALSQGKVVVLEIDVQGASAVKRAYPEALTIFIEPPSPAALKERLKKRSTDSNEVIARRLELARREMEEKPNYDFSFVNDNLNHAVEELEGIILKFKKEMTEGKPTNESA